jgi:excisionase family DNA binding protein
MAKQLEDRQAATEALAALRRRPRRLTLHDGTTVRLPKVAVDGLIEMLDAVAHGEDATVVRAPREVTTQQAATLLNVSRPTIVKLVDDGTLPARKVGSHRRVLLTGLLAYRDKIVAERRAVLDQMTRDAEDLGLYDYR